VLRHFLTASHKIILLDTCQSVISSRILAFVSIPRTTMHACIWRFLRPDIRRVLLFAVFLFIVVGSNIQSYAFIDGEEQGIPKPPLYDLLRPFPFWAMEMSLMLPILLVFMPFRSAGLSYFGWSGLFQVVYFYLFSCFIFFSYDEYRSRLSRKYWLIAAIVSAWLHSLQ
jgi:hypothetical protein